MNWDNYDKWKLSTPWDNEKEIEVFKAEKYNYFSCYENRVNDFDSRIEKLKDMWHISYDSYEEAIEDLAENLGLCNNEHDAIELFGIDEKSEMDYALECKYDEEIENRRLKK